MKIATFDLSPDVLDAIEAGNMLFAIDQQQYLQGYLPVVLLTLYNTNLNTIANPVLMTGPGFVTQDTAARVKDLSEAGTRYAAPTFSVCIRPDSVPAGRFDSEPRSTPMSQSAPATASPTIDELPAPPSSLKRLLLKPEMGAIAGAVVVWVIFAIKAGDNGFLSFRGIANYLQVSAELGILAVAVALLMIGGELDLSIGSTIGAAA